MNILSQRDPRWANIKLGTSNVTIGGYGCTITCLAMVSGITPDIVNQKFIDGEGFANGNLVIWSKVNLLPWCQFEWRGNTYDNERVKKAIADYGACLVEVDFDGSDRTDDRHWVVYIGNGRMYDPWTGTEESTNKYPVRGFSVIKRIPQPVQAPSEVDALKVKIFQLESDKNGLWQDKQRLFKAISDARDILNKITG